MNSIISLFLFLFFLSSHSDSKRTQHICHKMLGEKNHEIRKRKNSLKSQETFSGLPKLLNKFQNILLKSTTLLEKGCVHFLINRTERLKNWKKKHIPATNFSRNLALFLDSTDYCPEEKSSGTYNFIIQFLSNAIVHRFPNFNAKRTKQNKKIIKNCSSKLKVHFPKIFFWKKNLCNWNGFKPVSA